jgi:hypothetical protein
VDVTVASPLFEVIWIVRLVMCTRSVMSNHFLLARLTVTVISVPWNRDEVWLR